VTFTRAAALKLPGVAKALARDTRARVGGDVAVTITVPHLRIVSTPNVRAHWRVAGKLARHQKDQLALFARGKVLPALPVRVTITRVYTPPPWGKGKRLDPDNLTAGCKHVIDAVADLYGVTDADPEVIAFATWQQAGASVKVEVTIEPVWIGGAS
jgi:hypothetical protein